MTDQHKHCPMCKKPIPLSEKFCSPSCEQVYLENQRKIAKTRRILYVVIWNIHCVVSCINFEK